jgi:cyclopropane-fatty-acyl-phospholipid synthase
MIAADLPTEVFAAFLDRRLKYSSGLYRHEGVQLDEAQTAKLHFVAERLEVAKGARVLDVGCGWGSLVLFLAQEYGCHVTGVTPSRPQAAYVQRLAEELGVGRQVEVRVGSFSDTETVGRFDAVAMMGSIVHMPDRSRVLRKAHRLLRREGKLYLSESCFRNDAVHREFIRYVTETVFGSGDMMPLSALVESIEMAGFSLIGLTDLTAHYQRTTVDWENRAVANQAIIDRIAPGLGEHLIRYLGSATAGWGHTTKHYALTASKSRLGPEIPPRCNDRRPVS